MNKALISAAVAAAVCAFAPGAATAQTSTLVTFDVTGIYSNGEFGDALNEVFFLNVGAWSSIVSVGWDVTLFADSPSQLWELSVDLTASDILGGLTLSPGYGDNFSGTASYSSNGQVDLVGLGLNFEVGADGLLRLEFSDAVSDFPGQWEGIWQSGTLTFGVVPIPEPSTYGLMGLGLLGVAAAARRRRAS